MREGSVKMANTNTTNNNEPESPWMRYDTSTFAGQDIIDAPATNNNYYDYELGIEDINGMDKQTLPETLSSKGNPNKPGSEVNFMHGFFLGKPHKNPLWSSQGEHLDQDPNTDGDDFTDDETIKEIYSTDSTGTDLWSRSSSRSFQCSPEKDVRPVMSQRISNVGHMGQNLGLGHRIGIFREDAELTPKAIEFEDTMYVITEDSPTQTDIRWNRPKNAANFSTLMYDIDVTLPDDVVWTPLSCVRQTVFRVYHTDDKLLISRHRIQKKKKDVTLNLRVCCRGEMVFPDGVRHMLSGQWSRQITIIFTGYDSECKGTVQTTSL